nr:retrotransposon protein, putative, Ty3-gypsy subclass [Tanacetum cinerariifolium]
EFLEINESIYFNQEGSKAFLEQFKLVIDRLKHQGYIGEEPLKHWKKNGKFCKLDIINPDITIEDRPLKHMTPAMEDSFKKHVDSLLKIGSKAFLEQFKPVIERLKQQGYIGEEPLKHWIKNGELCKLDIINPDITIEDRPLKHVTPAMEDSFKKHVDSLLKIGAIRPSKSRHRTMAMIVNSGTTIDPVTGKEVKGKERMVFNYKSLNDNTYKDQYSLPGINTIIKRIRGAKIFLKFDLC